VYLLPHRYKLAAVIVAMLAYTGLGILSPWPIKFVVDHVLGQQPLFGRSFGGSQAGLFLALAAGTYLLLAVFRGLLDLLRQRWLAEVSQQAALVLHSDVYSRVQRLSLSFYDRARVGDTVTRITTDVERLQTVFVHMLSMIAVDLTTVLGTAVVILVMDWKFALVALLIVPPLFLIFTVFRRRLLVAARALRSSEGAMASMANETLSSIRVVRVFGQEDREQERFVDQTSSKAAAGIQAAVSEGQLLFWVQVTSAIGIALVIGYGGWRILNGHLTVGEMLVFMLYLTALYRPLRELGRLTIMVQRAITSGQRIQELFDTAPEVPEPAYPIPLVRARGDIAFDGVSFEYAPDRPVLRGVTLAIKTGEVVAVTGPTGVGKSTLLSLLSRFYDPTQGRILLDGQDVRDFRLRSLRDQMSFVLQDTVLFFGSIRDNIAYGSAEASDEAIVAAARSAHAHDFITALPEGYDTILGERGATLSGGQRQRIAIARAILKDAPILVLDEPTSAVDEESERLIMEALARLIKGRTVIIVSHRPSFVKMAQRVFVLKDGTITEVGSLQDSRNGDGAQGKDMPYPSSGQRAQPQ
jgi:ABC-type multidrug transport system fused ATPase/permease subunit